MARSAIITGSDSGIGKATAITLARQGYHVGITYRSDEEGAEEAAAEVRAAGGRAVVRQLDVTAFDAAPDTVRELADELGGLDVFVNNAGKGPDAAFLELELADWQGVIDADLTGAFVCAQAAARHMIEHGTKGRIVNVTSVHEHVPLPGAAAYCAAKGGLGLLTKLMALELAEHGITVNAVAPGEIATPMTAQHEADPQAQERSGIPLGRPGDAYEIAHAIAFLASPEASYATGSSVVVDGGLLLMAAVRDS